MTEPFAGHASISLEEVVARADLQTRRDRKYLVPVADALPVLDGAEGRVLEIDGRRSFGYESVYFDTPRWASYLGAARRRPSRFKVRTRTYLDSGDCVLEVKVRDRRGNTVKHRLPYDVSTRDRLTAEGTRFVAGFEEAAAHVDDLRSVLTVTYQRSTFVLAGDLDRITVDRGVTWIAHHPGVDDAADGPPEARAQLGGLLLIEAKTPGRPCALDRALWRAGHRPVSISKFGTGLALLDGTLPANRWHRVLERRLVPHLVVPSVPVSVA